MTVISNTSPLNYLVLIDLQQLLPALFARILVPDAVLRELGSPAAPVQIRAWLDTSPDWLESRVVADVPSDLRQLGPGEREAIVLAESQKAAGFMRSLDCARLRRRAEQARQRRIVNVPLGVKTRLSGGQRQ